MRRDVMGNRQDGMWTGKAGEIFGVRREEIGAVVLGDGRRGVEAHCWVCGARRWGEQSAHRLNWEGREPISVPPEEDEAAAERRRKRRGKSSRMALVLKVPCVYFTRFPPSVAAVLFATGRQW